MRDECIYDTKRALDGGSGVGKAALDLGGELMR